MKIRIIHPVWFRSFYSGFLDFKVNIIYKSLYAFAFILLPGGWIPILSSVNIPWSVVVWAMFHSGRILMFSHTLVNPETASDSKVLYCIALIDLCITWSELQCTLKSYGITIKIFPDFLSCEYMHIALLWKISKAIWHSAQQFPSYLIVWQRFVLKTFKTHF